MNKCDSVFYCVSNNNHIAPLTKCTGEHNIQSSYHLKLKPTNTTHNSITAMVKINI